MFLQNQKVLETANVLRQDLPIVQFCETRCTNYKKYNNDHNSKFCYFIIRIIFKITLYKSITCMTHNW